MNRRRRWITVITLPYTPRGQ